MDKIIVGLASLLLGTGFLNFLQFLIARHDRKKSKAQIDPARFDELVKLQLANSQEWIVQRCRTYLRRGYIFVKEKAMVHAIYEPYSNLGANHFAQEAIEEIDKLPVKEGEGV